MLLDAIRQTLGMLLYIMEVASLKVRRRKEPEDLLAFTLARCRDVLA
jgi:hypothetical protein